MIPSVSVIVPVYNTEQYFPECAKALMAQTLKELEIILVDDGSTDSSGKMCDEYAKQDSRIRVIHKQNGGVAAARQTGLDAATGEYVIWADSDDWMEQDMYEKMYLKAKEKDADLCVCGCFVVFENTYQREMKQHQLSDDKKNCIYEFFQGKITSSLCLKMFNLSFIQKNQISFEPHIDSGEDLLFAFKYIWNTAQKIATIENGLYYYRQNNFSATHNFQKKTLDDDYYVYCKIQETVYDTEFYETFTMFWKNHFGFISIRVFESYFDSNKNLLNESLLHYMQIPVKNMYKIRLDRRILCFFLSHKFYLISHFILFVKKVFMQLFVLY